MKIDHVDEVKNEMGIGITEPLNCVMDDGTSIVFKMHNNPEGNKVLVNEFICLHIAKKLKLPIPNGGIATIDEKTKINKTSLNTDINNGLGFYSVRLDNVTSGLIGQSSMIQKYCTNQNDFIPIILFDHLVYNKDRNNGNLLWSFKDKKIYVIDNSHCFYLGSLWDNIQLEMWIKDEDYRHNRIMEDNFLIYEVLINIYNLNQKSLYNIAKEFQQKLNDEFLEQIFNDVPKEWQVSDSDLGTLKKYIKYRIDNIYNMCDVIYNYRR